MAIENEKTIELLRKLGAPDKCPEQLSDPNPTGYEYRHSFSVTDRLICAGQKTTGGIFHPTCVRCKIRGREFPEYNNQKYMEFCFGKDWDKSIK